MDNVIEYIGNPQFRRPEAQYVKSWEIASQLEEEFEILPFNVDRLEELREKLLPYAAESVEHFRAVATWLDARIPKNSKDLEAWNDFWDQMYQDMHHILIEQLSQEFVETFLTIIDTIVEPNENNAQLTYLFSYHELFEESCDVERRAAKAAVNIIAQSKKCNVFSPEFGYDLRKFVKLSNLFRGHITPNLNYYPVDAPIQIYQIYDFEYKNDVDKYNEAFERDDAVRKTAITLWEEFTKALWNGQIGDAFSIMRKCVCPADKVTKDKYPDYYVF